LKPPALLGVNLRAGPVGSVWGLAPGRVGALGKLPMTLLAQPRGIERSRGVRWRQREGFQEEVESMSQSFGPEGEEDEKMDNITKTKKKTKRRKVAPIEIRMKTYNDVFKLRKRGLSLTKIRNKLYRKYGVWISESTISRWLHGVTSPYNGRRIPSLELLKPSEDLGYVIGVRLGDGYTSEKSDGYIIGLRAKDIEFVEKFGRCLGNVLGRKPIRPKKYAGTYVAEATSKTLYELLRKPVDLKRIRKYVEHCKKCIATFLRGLFDSEGCVSEKGYITLINSNYEVLVYAQRLLRERFGIESTGPWPYTRKGTIMHDPRTGKQYKTKKDCYYIYIRAESLPKFYQLIGFTIRRKQKRLEDYLRRKGLLQED
jgi:intein-encoded DNA endonuclease-like protein